MVAVHSGQLLASGSHEPDGQVVVGVKQQGGNGRCVSAAGNLMLRQEVANSRQIHSDAFGHDVERTSKRQDGVHVLDMGVEREGAVAADAVGGSQVLHVDNHIDEST